MPCKEIVWVFTDDVHHVVELLDMQFLFLQHHQDELTDGVNDSVDYGRKRRLPPKRGCAYFDTPSFLLLEQYL